MEDLQELAQEGIKLATSSGASYADSRVDRYRLTTPPFLVEGLSIPG